MKKLVIFLAFILLIFWYAAADVQAADFNFEVTEISFSPKNPPINVGSEINIKVLYTGNDPLVSNSLLSDNDFDFDNAQVMSVELPTISGVKPVESGKYFTITYNVIFKEVGRQSIFFQLNEGGSSLEGSRSDNDLREYAECIYPDDFAIKEIVVYPEVPGPGAEAYIKIGIENKGYRDLSSDLGLSSYSYDFGDFVVTSKKIPQASVQDKFKMKEVEYYYFYGNFPTSGAKDLSFTVDNGEIVDEFNEDNNTLTKSLTILDESYRDLSIKDISLDLDPDRLIKGDNVTITVTIQNSGDISILSGEGFEINDIYYDFEGVGNILKISNNELPSFENPFDKDDEYEYVYTGTFNDSGKLNLHFQLDKRNELAEINEANNTRNEVITVYATENEADQFQITNVRYELASPTAAVIRFDTNQESIGLINYRLARYNDFSIYHFDPHLQDWPEEEEATKEHKFVLDNLRAGEEYLYQVFSTRNNVDKESEVLSFIAPMSDKPSLYGDIIVGGDRAKGTVIVTWKTNILADTYLYYRKVGTDKYTVISDKVHSISHSASKEKLTNGTYEFYVVSNSINGKSYQSALRTFTIGAKVESGDEPEEVEVEAPKVGAEPEPEIETGDEPGNKNIRNEGLYNNLKGKIILTVEQAGEAYWLNPQKKSMHYLGRPEDAFRVMREQGLGIKNSDLYKIAIGSIEDGKNDSDGDGLADNLEESIGLNPDSIDTDGDGYNDKDELNGGYNPWGEGKQSLDNNFTNAQKGKILLQVEKNGEAWYVNPNDNKRYFLGRPADAFQVMRHLGLGISNSNFESL